MMRIEGRGSAVASPGAHVRDFMTPPILLQQDQTLLEAAAALVEEEGVGALVMAGEEVAGTVIPLNILSRLCLTLEAGAGEDSLAEALASEVGEMAEPVPDSCSDTDPLRAAFQTMVRGETPLVPVVNRSDVVGVVSTWDAARALADGVLPAPPSQAGTPRVEDWMSRRVVRVDPEHSLSHALELMAEEGIRHVLVTRSGGLAGILSNRDLVRAARASRRKTLELSLDRCKVGRVMTPLPLHTTNPATPLREAAGIMTRRKVSALPVLEGDDLVGIITSQDVLDAAACGAFER